jgi:hypothetical protein
LRCPHLKEDKMRPDSAPPETEGYREMQAEGEMGQYTKSYGKYGGAADGWD